MNYSNPWRKWALLSALLWSSPLWTACTRTKIVEKPVEVRVPFAVEIHSLCPASLPELPPRPRASPDPRCAELFGTGASCFTPGEVVRLASLLGVLTGLYTDRKSCEPTGHAGNQTKPDAGAPRVP